MPRLQLASNIPYLHTKNENRLRGESPGANYTDLAATAYRRS
jgi:hypothetical protein